ncbi:MAG TPA: S4 domain-containing protein YaaA [Acholeplasmataceae bacterium]|jgi:ribosome-associated protein|nr:S4 domain-containing protein YaaA [Acholeplasmataceae bacterium]
MKTVIIHTEYITLGQFLKYINEISSGAMAKLFLSEGRVKVNGEIESRRGRKLYPGYVVNVENKQYKIGKKA